MNLTRNEPSKCVMARIMRRGEQHQKNFSLRKYQTWESAEQAAKRWVNKMKKELPSETPRKGRMTKRNSSGVVGVWPIIDRHKRDGHSYEYARWGARWPECPVKGGIRFSVNEYGDDDAFILACMAVKDEETDREQLIKKLKRFKKTKQCQKLLDLKQVQFV